MNSGELVNFTPTSSYLLDLVVTTRKDLINTSGAFPLGISDHNLVYATMRLKNNRPQPKYVKTLKTRNFKNFNLDNFRRDIETAPFHMASVFDDPDDVSWAWLSLFVNICDEHAPWKEVKIRSRSAPWITNEIRGIKSIKDINYLKQLLPRNVQSCGKIINRRETRSRQP